MLANARTITSNLMEAMRFFGRAREDGEVHEMPGVSVIYCGLDYAAFNAGVMGDSMLDDAADLERRIQGPADHFESRRLRWSYWYCDDLVGKTLLPRARALLARHGMVELTDAPGMMAHRLMPPSRALPSIEVRPVADENTRAAFGHITSLSFEVPWTICREVYGAERAWRGSFRGYVGFADGMAVSTAAVVVASGVAGIYSVGTIPGQRGRGYAEALMRGVLDRVREETGIERTVLQSTRTGFSMYSRMGYQPVTTFTVFITD
jgi:ribosomal protein S18 acetylase RimI-like enzyme